MPDNVKNGKNCWDLYSYVEYIPLPCGGFQSFKKKFVLLAQYDFLIVPCFTRASSARWVQQKVLDCRQALFAFTVNWLGFAHLR